MLSHFSLRNAPFPERVAAAASAGFAGIGLYVGEYLRLLGEGWTDERLGEVLEEHGMRIVELEVLNLETRRGEQDLFHLAATFHPRHMQVVPGLGREADLDALTATFVEVCDRAAEFDLLIAFEYLPFTGVPDAVSAMRIVDAASRANGGLCADSWHHFRGTQAPFPSTAVRSIQIDDGPFVPDDPDSLHACLHSRRPPGEGEFPLAGWLAMLPHDVPMSVEVISDELDRLPPAEVALRLASATRRVLAA